MRGLPVCERSRWRVVSEQRTRSTIALPIEGRRRVCRRRSRDATEEVRYSAVAVVAGGAVGRGTRKHNGINATHSHPEK